MKWLADEIYPDTNKIRIVLNNLDTHKPSALYEAFPPEEAHRIMRRLEFVHTLKHDSWPNLAEIELNALNNA